MSLKMIHKIKIIIKEKLRKREKNILLMNLIWMMLSKVNNILNSKIQKRKNFNTHRGKDN